MDFKMNPWDIAPMQAIVPAAGGVLRCVPDKNHSQPTYLAFGANTALFDAVESVVEQTCIANI